MLFLTCVVVALIAFIAYGFGRRRGEQLRALNNDEITARLGYDPAEFGIDISMWPSRAPRNGTAHDDTTPV